MKKSFKKLGFVSLATSSVLLGSMNATNLETYAALQKPSHVFGNYVEKEKGKEGSKEEALTGSTNGSGKSNSGSTPTPSTPPTKKDDTSGSGSDKDQHTASSGTPTSTTPPAKEGPSSSGSGSTPSSSGNSVAS